MILGPYSDVRLAGMSEAELTAYDTLLQENDQDLYQWVSGQSDAPDHVEAVLADVRAFLAERR